jgi:hypothetical protein
MRTLLDFDGKVLQDFSGKQSMSTHIRAKIRAQIRGGGSGDPPVTTEYPRGARLRVGRVSVSES